MITVSQPVDADQLRLRHEFLEMPGLVLTITQAARLLGIRSCQAEDLLNSLVDDGFLVRRPEGTFRRTM